MTEIVVQPAKAADYPAFAGLFPELGVDDPVPDEAEFTERMTPRTRIASIDGRVAGYLYFNPQPIDHLHVNHVVVAPWARRLGVGTALLVAARREGVSAGCRTWSLFVKADNAAAIGLYRKGGLERAHGSVPVRLTWEQVLALPAAAAGTIRDLAPVEDPLIETRFALRPGRLATFRSFGSPRLLLLEVDGAARGIAVFTPNFPGVALLRADDLADATALLRAIYPLRRTDFPEAVADWRRTGMQVMVDDAHELLDLLEARGGRPVMRLWFMTGVLDPDR